MLNHRVLPDEMSSTYHEGRVETGVFTLVQVDDSINHVLIALGHQFNAVGSQLRDEVRHCLITDGAAGDCPGIFSQGFNSGRAGHHPQSITEVGGHTRIQAAEGVFVLQTLDDPLLPLGGQEHFVPFLHPLDCLGECHRLDNERGVALLGLVSS